MFTYSALLAGVVSSSFVSAYDTKLRRGISCNEDKDISSNVSQLENLANKDVTNGDEENLVEDDELDNYEDNRRVHKDNRSSYEDTDSVDKVPTVNKHETEISKLKDNKSSSESDLLKSLDLKTVASIISASSSIGILSGLSKKLYFDKKVNPTKPDDHIQDDDKNKDNPDPRKKEEKNDEPVPSPVTPGNGNSNKKYIVNPTNPNEPEPHIQDDDKNKDNPDPRKKDEPPTTPDNSGNKKSPKLWWLMCIAPVILLVLVIVYKRAEIRKWAGNFASAMYIKCFGLVKFLENYDILSKDYDECKGLFKKILSNNDFQAWSNAYECTQYMKKNGPVRYLDHFKNNTYAWNNWKEVYKIAFGKDIDEDIAKKLFYRHENGYEIYIKNHPNDWWNLYNEDYLKFLEVESEEMNYVVSLILEILYKNPGLYFNSVYNSAYEIVNHATNYCMFWFSKLAREDEAAKSVELSKDGHFLVKDKNNGSTVTFKYLNSFLKLAKDIPISDFNDRLSNKQVPEYENSYVFFAYFLYIDDPDDAFINIMLIPDSEISKKANDAISLLGILVSKLDSINFENSVKEKLFLNLNKLLDYFRVTFNNCEEIKRYIKKDKYYNSKKVDGEKNLTYDEANNILRTVKIKIKNNNNNNNIPKINSQANNCLN